MKQKRSTSPSQFLAGVKEAGSEFRPLVVKPYRRARAYLEARPRKTIIWMMVIALSNFGLWMYIAHKHPVKDFSIADMPFNKVKEKLVLDKSAVPFSLANYMAISKLKDSLNYLLSKKELSREDTLLFIRIAQQYERIDPAFFRRLHPKNKTP